MNRMVYLKDVVSLAYDREKCVGCGICSVVCPHGVMAQDNGKADITDRDLCMECGACAMNCPTQAVTVTSGVGCVAAVINSVLGRNASACCCSTDGQGAGC